MNFGHILKNESRIDAKLSSLTAPKIVMKTISGATSDDKVGIVTTHGLQYT